MIDQERFLTCRGKQLTLIIFYYIKNPSPTITECANEPQIESKSEMRRRISNLGPKVVSPKRTLGTGPVLVGRLEPVKEGGEIKDETGDIKDVSISLPSMSSNASGIIIPMSARDNRSSIIDDDSSDVQSVQMRLHSVC